MLMLKMWEAEFRRMLLQSSDVLRVFDRGILARSA
jgi:hypothetical protein